jgi:hypothetical protein
MATGGCAFHPLPVGDYALDQMEEKRIVSVGECPAQIGEASIHARHGCRAGAESGGRHAFTDRCDVLSRSGVLGSIRTGQAVYRMLWIIFRRASRRGFAGTRAPVAGTSGGVPSSGCRADRQAQGGGVTGLVLGEGSR